MRRKYMEVTKEIEVTRRPETMPKKYTGKGIKRKHSYSLIQGKGTFAEDVDPPRGTFYVSFVRSPFARAKILSIDTSKALELEGVIEVFTGEDFPDVSLGYWMHLPTLMEPRRRPLAIDHVMYNGEPVVAVVAVDQYTAEDAAELVEVNYEPEDPVLDPFEAIANPGKKIFDDMKDNILYTDSYSSTSDLQEIINNCALVIEETYKNGRSTTITLEPRVQIASYDGDRLDIWSTTQYPHVLRTYISEMLDISEGRVRVYALDVGGGWGPKSAVFSDDATVYAIAVKMKATVKWVETRTEDLLTTGHERDQIHKIRAGYNKNGRLVAFYDEMVADVGAGTTFWAEVQPAMVASVTVPGPYKFANYGFDLKAVTTNKAPWSPNVGFGRPIAALVMERTMDMAARKLNMDPAQIRKINLVHKDEYPYKSPSRVVYDSGDYEGGLEKLKEIMHYDDLIKLRNQKRKEGKYLGIGLGVYSEYTAPSSFRLQKILGWEVGGYEKAVIKVSPSGKVTVNLGVMDSGQGHDTVYAQVAADGLGVDIDDVFVYEGDTERDPYGFGSWASRSTVTAGNAVLLAAEKVRKKVLRIAAHSMGTDVEHLEISGGVIRSRKSSKTMTLEEVAKIAYRRSVELPEGEEPEIEEHAIFESPNENTVVSYAWHGVLAEVDPEVGEIRLLKYYVVDDAGVIINPLSAEGQVHGSTIAHGMQQTFHELKYNEEGVLMTSNFWDYIPISTLDVPEVFEIANLESPSTTPGGYKGMGEGGAIGAPPAISNAISDALSPLGIEIKKIPISWEDVWDLVQEKRNQ